MGFSAGLRPAPATIQSNSNSNSRSWFPEGWRGGSGCGRRRKPFHGAWPRHPCRGHSQPDPSRLQQSSAICRDGALRCCWWVSTLVDTVDPRHAWMTHSISERKSCRPRSTPTNSRAEQSCSCQQPREPVEGGAVSACGVSAAWMRLPSLHGRTCGVPARRHRPAKPRNLALALALALAVALSRCRAASPAEHPYFRGR